MSADDLSTEKAAAPGTKRAVLDDLLLRCSQAELNLRNLAQSAGGKERARLTGKVEGVLLARSYIEEARRNVR